MLITNCIPELHLFILATAHKLFVEMSKRRTPVAKGTIISTKLSTMLENQQVNMVIQGDIP
jgi:hypothetical protein